jgi:dienelactone hydrolase
MMPAFAHRAVLLTALVLCAASARAEALHREELRIPMAAAGARGLEALLVRPDGPGKFPLVLLSHGTPRDPKTRKTRTPWAMYPQALEFARRGWAAVVVMRRGYGESGGQYAERSGLCSNPEYVESSKIATQDLKAAIVALARRPDIDATRILAVGVSAGGLATVALTADAPPGLVAAISFAGGRGSPRDFTVCHEERLIAAFRTFGKTSRVPMLWVYSENDHFFPPDLAQKLHDAFTTAGGNAEFIKAAPFGKDGHRLFSLAGIQIWTGFVDAFLARHKLLLRAEPLPLPVPPGVKAPPQLSAKGRKAFFEIDLRGGLHKAFAVSSKGDIGWQTARRTTDEATVDALKFCRKHAKDCRVVFIDDAPAPSQR